MKKLMLSIVLVMGLALTLTAQDSPTTSATSQKKQRTPEEHAKHGANWAVKNLGLDADQASKWQAAALERINANNPLREKMKGATTPEDRKTLHGMMKVNMDKFETTVNTFLNADQKAKWDKIKEEKKAKNKGKKDVEIDLEPEK